MKTFLAIITLCVSFNAAAIPAECQPIGPADAAVLTNEQLAARLCSAAQAQSTAATGSKDREACFQATQNIVTLIFERKMKFPACENGMVKSPLPKASSTDDSGTGPRS